MVEKVITASQNVVDFARYQAGRNGGGMAPAVAARTCRHCGAGLLDGESQDDCSSVSIDMPGERVAARKFYVD